MRLGVHLLLAHEALGVEGCKPPRFACEFGDFFSATPQALLAAGIYSELATPLKQVPCRAASMVMLVKAVAASGAQSPSLAGVTDSPGTREQRFQGPVAPSFLVTPLVRATREIESGGGQSDHHN